MQRRAKTRGWSRARAVAWASASWLCLSLGVASPSAAQTAQERQAAAEAFDRGTTSLLAEDFNTAARWFEMANNLAPAAPALLQAIRAHQRAGNELRAGTLSLRLVERFPDAGSAVEEAQRILDAMRGSYFLVEVVCDEECAVELDGTLQAHPAFFLQPGRAHRVGASFASGNTSEEITGEAGEQRTLRMTAPEGPAIQAPPGDTGSTGVGTQGTTGDSAWTRRDDGREEPREESGGGIHPAGFLTTLALTLGSAGVLVWSGMDTLSARDAYEEEAASARMSGDYTLASEMLDDGRTKELRTNVLIGTTAGLAAITVILAIVTDWGGSDDEASAGRVSPSLAVGPNGAQVGLGGSF
ncbi:MAG: hypothetical protein H6722_06990 [Sandaracinus sp.]|nr:hypothetical protein [Sandaracinus sp.]MCB9618393.1 hypothetical protein [Sandaracinus sp.]MCB9623080.1 hypothetical protein [Sandaracinus sp.]